MRCGAARALLPLYVDGALSVSKHQELDEHLRVCGACKEERARLEAPLPPLPPIPDEIMTRFNREFDICLNARLDALRYEKPPRPFRGINLSWPAMFISSAVVGATTSLAVSGVVFYQARTDAQSSRPIPVVDRSAVAPEAAAELDWEYGLEASLLLEAADTAASEELEELIPVVYPDPSIRTAGFVENQSFLPKISPSRTFTLEQEARRQRPQANTLSR